MSTALTKLTKALFAQKLLSFLVFTAMTAIFCALSYCYWDKAFLLWLEDNCASGAIFDFFKTITDVGEATLYLLISGLLAGVVLLVVLLLPKTHARRGFLFMVFQKLLFVFLSLVLAGLVVTGLKALFGRWRPYYFLHNDLYGFHFFISKVGLNSFPSGHSQVIWTVATALSLLEKRLVWGLLPLAVLVSASRMVTRYHYLSDVVAGAWVGLVCTLIVYWALQRFFQASVAGARF